MIEKVQVRKAGGSLTIVLPSAMAKKLAISAGAQLWIAETHEGLLISTNDAEFRGVANAVAEAVTEHRQALIAFKR